MSLRLNIGCGNRKIEGFVNADKFAACDPDILFDAEAFPWPWETSLVDEIRFIHSLEHMGADTGVFLGIIKETYRVLKPGGTVRIEVPHPRHDYFLGDPTHVRAITARQMLLFDRRLNDEWKAAKSSAATPLAHYLDVDFEMVEQTELADPRHLAAIKAGRMSVDELIQAGLEQNNVFTEIHMTLKARKP